MEFLNSLSAKIAIRFRNLLIDFNPYFAYHLQALFCVAIWLSQDWRFLLAIG